MAHDTDTPTIDLATSDANVAHMLDEPIATTPSAAAFVRIDEAGRSEQVITFERLHRLISAVAGGLRERGVGRGSAVVTALSPSIESLIFSMAAWRIGATLTPLGPGIDRKRIDQVARMVEAEVVVLDGNVSVLRAVAALRWVDVLITTTSRRVPGTLRFTDLLATPVDHHVTEPVHVAANDIAVLQPPMERTSGVPEPRTHGGLRRRHQAMAELWPDLTNELMWTNLPEATLHALSRGVGTIVPPRAPRRSSETSARRTHRLINASGATVLVLDPTTMSAIGHTPGRAQLDRVTFAATGGPLATPDLLASLQAVLPNAQIATVYGSRDAGAIGSARAADVLARRDEVRESGGVYIGQLAPSIPTRIIRVVDGPLQFEAGAHLEDWEQSPGTTGELLVQVAPGEFIPEASDTLTDERGQVWRRTNHIVRQEVDGTGVWLLGRRGQGWNVAGQRMWALQLETPVTDLAEVERAATCMPKFDGSSREFKNASAVLAVEPARGYHKDDARRAAERALKSRGLDASVEVRALSRIPVLRSDPTRVDVAALHDKLRPENNEDY
jgi:acyl-coenzyme A synthetase/AMP-(fatty) acid ligase